MKLRGSLVLAALVFATFFASYAGTSSATALCKIKLPECSFGNDLPVPETIPATMSSASAVFSPTPGTSTSCKASSMELTTTEDLGFAPEPLLAEITSWKFGSCTSCTTVTANISPPFKAEFQAILEGGAWQGNGTLKILSPEIKLSGCPLAAVCTASAASIVLKVRGGSPMKFIANSVPMNLTGSASCPASTTLSAEYSVTKYKELWLEPVP